MTSRYIPRRRSRSEERSVRGLRHQLTIWPGSDPEPLFLLHGWMDTGETFQFLVDAMSDHWTCVAPDWRGFGRTQWPDDGYWFPDYFADLENLLEQLAPDRPVTLIGHSMGGNIATLYAGIRPERVRRVVCIEGFGLARTHPEQAPERFRKWLDQLREPPEFANFPSFEALALLLQRRNPRLSDEHADFIARAWAIQSNDGTVRARPDPAHKRVNPNLYRRDESEACWREITAPVLYVTAEHSEFLSRLGEDGTAENMAKIIPNLQPCVIPDASHMVHHEQAEVLAREIQVFLAET